MPITNNRAPYQVELNAHKREEILYNISMVLLDADQQRISHTIWFIRMKTFIYKKKKIFRADVSIHSTCD